MAQQKNGPDATEMLKADHEKVKGLFSEYETSKDEQILRQIFQELEVHTVLEEEIFYPAVRDEIDPSELGAVEGETGGAAKEEGEDFIAISYEEHAAVKDLIKELQGAEPTSEAFQERFAELRDDVLDHASEEEDVLLPVAKMKLDVHELGARMARRKDELLGAATAGR